jgi:adenosylcobinamide-GDP ribazoletransferase
MKRLGQAIGFLTIFPVRQAQPPRAGDLGRAAAWFPLIGALIGALVWLVKFGLDRIFPALVSAGLCVALWAILTGGLHLDGLADCCDGMLNASPPERRLEIMRDPRIGSFGVIGLLLVLMLKTFALAALPAYPQGLAIVLAAVISRWLILWAGRQPLARSGGLGADFALGLQKRAFILAAILPVALMLLLTLLDGWPVLLAVALAHLSAWGIFRAARTRLCGVTGDVFGLTVEISELVILLVFTSRLPAL